MGGGTHQVNNQQANAADANATAASNQNLALSKQYGGQEADIFNRLFGKSGSLNGMMDPKSLTQTGLNPAYQSQYNQASNQIAKGYSDQRGSLARSWANSGMGANNTPNGFQSDQMRKLGSSEADTRGATFSGLMGTQYQDALKNFWNAHNVAAGQAANTGTTSVSGATGAGNTQAELFGTAGKQKQTGTSAATGIAESFCPAEGSQILLANGTRKKIEDLRKGDFLFGIDSKPDELIDDPQVSAQQVCEVLTRKTKTRCSLTHAFVRSAGGYAIAAKSLGEQIDTDYGPSAVLEVRILGEKMVCFHLFLKRSHGFNSDGMWSLE